MTLFIMHFVWSLICEKSFFDASFCLKLPPVFAKNIQSCVGEMVGSDTKMGNVCVCLVLGMVVPGSDAWDTTVWVLGT